MPGMRPPLHTTWLLLLLALAGCTAQGPPRVAPLPAPTGTFTLWQLPEQSRFQGMSYVLATGSGQLVVLDGGTRASADYLRTFLEERGGRIEAWFLTHPHVDHVGALLEILAQPQPPPIASLFGSLPRQRWIEAHAKPAEVEVAAALRTALQEGGLRLQQPDPGAVIWIDGVRFEVLSRVNPGIHRAALNNSSLVLRVSDRNKSVLFFGDLEWEGGRKLLAGPYGDRLRADYVQMAHHGQRGVDEAVYRAVQPRACLWPTPAWLWENDDGGGPDSGPWTTLETRAWMDALGVEAHYVMKDGLLRIEE